MTRRVLFGFTGRKIYEGTIVFILLSLFYILSNRRHQHVSTSEQGARYGEDSRIKDKTASTPKGLRRTDRLKHSNRYNLFGIKQFWEKEVHGSRAYPDNRVMNLIDTAPAQAHKMSKEVIDIVWYRPYMLNLRQHASQVDMSLCQYKNCRISSEHAVEQGGVMVFDLSRRRIPGDVILFQGNNIAVPFPNKQDGQIFVFVDLESPGSKHLRKTPLHLRKFKHAFNWTMTYRKDSDIPFPYGVIMDRDAEDIPEGKSYHDIFTRKSRKSFWISSHCNVDSGRLQYVQLLKNYTEVDAFGACGQTLQCSKPQNPMFSQLRTCELDLVNSYMFYLALENTLCYDYVTEKVFRWYSKDVVLVVRGAPNYNEILPEGTYINSADFSSTKDLADYLNYLSNNETEYIGYLKRKAKFDVQNEHKIIQKAYCDLCYRANDPERFQYSYRNISEWLSTAPCRSPDDLV